MSTRATDVSIKASLLACLAAHLPRALKFHLGDVGRCLDAGFPPRAVPGGLPEGALRERLAPATGIWDEVERALDWCEANDVRLLGPGHPEYPERFLTLAEPSPALFVKGGAPWQTRIGLAVVGSRAPARATLEWLDSHLTPVLANPGVYSVSGGARGVDQKAHALSLRVGAPTVAFLPSGLARIYPAEFASWSDAIVAAGGALVTEYPPWKPMCKNHFHSRNRLIAKLGAVCLIAEAGRKSGTMITARYAAEAGVPLATLPASPMEPKAMGSLDLLFDGAQMLRDARDLGECLALNARLGAG